MTEKTVKLNEKYRAYDFGPFGKIELENVIELVVRDSGTHRLKTADGHLHIVPEGWIHIEIEDEIKEWTL